MIEQNGSGTTKCAACMSHYADLLTTPGGHVCEAVHSTHLRVRSDLVGGLYPMGAEIMRVIAQATTDLQY
jgi:hypothetical protein